MLCIMVQSASQLLLVQLACKLQVFRTLVAFQKLYHYFLLVLMPRSCHGWHLQQLLPSSAAVLPCCVAATLERVDGTNSMIAYADT
jgi:hypothetical protein